jgi:hypothetical protein
VSAPCHSAGSVSTGASASRQTARRRTRVRHGVAHRRRNAVRHEQRRQFSTAAPGSPPRCVRDGSRVPRAEVHSRAPISLCNSCRSSRPARNSVTIAAT